MLKVLYYGGQKSGKSGLAEKRAIELADGDKPYYIATYDSSYGDNEMLTRVELHKQARKMKFETIEEQRDLVGVIKQGETYLIDCISMWILNCMDRDEKALLAHIDALAKIDANMIFVLNNLNEGITPIDGESRKFIDLTGVIGQRLAQVCDEVYEVKLGLKVQLK